MRFGLVVGIGILVVITGVVFLRFEATRELVRDAPDRQLARHAGMSISRCIREGATQNSERGSGFSATNRSICR